VTYCTTCDGPLFRNKKVVTIGGGNSALESALMLAEIASHVTVLNLNATFRGEQVLIDKVTQHPKIDVIYQAQTTRIEGEPVVERVVYTDLTTQEERAVDTQGVFVHIGLIPNSDFLPASIKKNNFGEIEITSLCETSVPGIFAAGDVTNTPYKQAVIAAGQGAVAALAAVDYLNKHS
jgi:alkyl hydroperoxide reductase subunit AhpF